MTDSPTLSEPEAYRCYAHPSVETYLRCGKCERPICTRCIIQTPVGARCRDCAQLRRLPIYDVRPQFLVRGAFAALLSSALGAIVIALLPLPGLFLLIIGPVYGVAVAAAVGKATNEKRGSSLTWMSVAMLIVGFGLGRAGVFFVGLPASVPMEARLSFALQRGLSADLGAIFLILIAAFVMYSRLR